MIVLPDHLMRSRKRFRQRFGAGWQVATEQSAPSGVQCEPMTQLPDLLHAHARRTIDETTTDTALVFAFSGSSSGGMFSEALDRATLAPSNWEPDCFVQDLFLKDFVRTCFQLRKQPCSMLHLLRTLASPPADPITVEFRRAITAELLASRPLLSELERVHDAVCRFRDLLETTTASDKWDPNRRQLELLAVFKKLIELMAQSFRDSVSGLSRLRSFAERVQRSEAYEAVVQLLRYDERLATLNFKVDIGADGRVRQLALVHVEENRETPFQTSPLRRWLAKLELFVRGYRFSEGEVMARLLDAVFEGIRPELPAIVQLLGDLEFYLGALGFADRVRSAGLSVCMPELKATDQPRRLLGLFNPLLSGAGMAPVPCDIHIDRHDVTVLITGPNSGGKTRLLQSLGLAQLMAQAGLFVPAREAQLCQVPGLVVSLIQETHAHQTEGRLGVELMRIRSLFERLPPRAMVILDELCSGTNPSEGEEIFEIVVGMLSLLRPQAFITTHFLQFAARLERERKIADLRFLQVELGIDHEPTYQFAPGVARTSLAGRAASRLGVTTEQLSALVDAKLARFGSRFDERLEGTFNESTDGPFGASSGKAIDNRPQKGE